MNLKTILSKRPNEPLAGRQSVVLQHCLLILRCRVSTACNKPWSYIPDGIMPVFWRVVYWTSQCLTWSVRI